MDWAMIWYFTKQQLLLLLKAPLYATEMWWIVSPLIVTFLVMTVYFGLYRREELGWNSALSNIIVLLFVSIDLLRTIFFYTDPPSLYNYGSHQVLTGTIFLIILEAMMLFYFAFTHKVPKRLMFFIASPLCINIQAYVIITWVYLELLPTRYTVFAGILMFLGLLLASQLFRLLQYPLMILRHKNKLHQARSLRHEAKMLRKKAKKAAPEAKKEMRHEASLMVRKAKNIEEHLKEEEHEEFGELRVAKALTKKHRKRR